MTNMTNLKTFFVISLFLIVLFESATTMGKVIYVDANAMGANIGSNWADAYNYLQDALADANSAEKPVEVQVAKGIYKPDQGAGVYLGDRDATFQLINGVALKGGYAGFDESDPNARDIELYETILSGDLNDDDMEVADPCDLLNEPTRVENSYHVVTGSGTDDTAIMDGFTITAGYANGDFDEPQSKGGGMYNKDGDPTITNCCFKSNLAAILDITLDIASGGNGGGICNDQSSPILKNCTFEGNYSFIGGGIANNYSSKSKLINCTFNGNSAESGGGMSNSRSYPMLLNCTFTGNSSYYNGGGMISAGSESELTGCIFAGNIARQGFGGGIYCDWESHPTITNCTFTGNWADIGNNGGIDTTGYFFTLTNCILWDNEPTTSYSSLAYYSSYCNIPDWYLDRGNIVTDPLFVKPGRWVDKSDLDVIIESNDPNAIWIDGDYHLKSQAGRWDINSESWVVDEVTSPCIDSGDPNSPVGDEPLPNGGVINMGAYGGTIEASKSPTYVNSVFKASNPSPADRSYHEDTEVILSWTTGLNVVSHDVYFGTSIPLTFIGKQTKTVFEPNTLEIGKTYFWRIDEVTNEGVTIGDIWRFTTFSSVPPPKGRACFTDEMSVWVDGILIPISTVEAGQNIGNINSTTVKGSLEKLPCLGEVERLEKHEGTFACYDILLESGNCINVAECHYFMAKSGQWIMLQNLKAGMKLQTAKGLVGIVSVTKRQMPYFGKVYNIKIKGSDKYMVGEDAVIVRDY